MSRCVDLTLIHPAKMCPDTPNIFINQVKRKIFCSYTEKCLLSRHFFCPKCLGANGVHPGHTLVSSEFVSHPRFLLHLVSPTHASPTFPEALSFPLSTMETAKDWERLHSVIDQWICFNCMHTKCFFNHVFKDFFFKSLTVDAFHR